MARCLGENPPYGCGHHIEHQAAARKGWITRRHGLQFAGTRQHKALSALFGEEISHAHAAPEHRNMVRFKNAGKWYELPRAEFNRLAHEGEQHIREQERAQRQHERETVKALKAEEKQQLQEAHYKQSQERQLAAARKAEYQSVTKRIKQLGGIRPYKASSTDAKNKHPELEEFKDLPRSVKTRDQRKGVALDDAAATIHEEYPWLKIQNDSDLRRYLIDEKKHTGPMARAYFNTPMPKEQKAAAPETINVAQTKVEPNEHFRYVATQKSNGRWILSRYYDSGRIKQEPKEYASNPLAQKHHKAKEQPGQSALFGGAHEESKKYSGNLFGQ